MAIQIKVHCQGYLKYNISGTIRVWSEIVISNGQCWCPKRIVNKYGGGEGVEIAEIGGQ